ncbi:hypothetical protein Nepgr_024612 [Nepenthes gracilis]|uniref:Uncharacterized protein n=1 Tax=Nepenthes gracilis TaxID=150966 RepID=A0AAD3Y071_NEPGR|nr:hypothetical protein Nepgr_024612 [Nepenthes gracilis]
MFPSDYNSYGSNNSDSAGHDRDHSGGGAIAASGGHDNNAVADNWGGGDCGGCGTCSVIIVVVTYKGCHD